VSRTPVVAAAVVVLASAAGAVALVQGRGSRPAPRQAPRRPAQAPAAVDVRVARTRLGPMLVDGRGRSLYLFVKDDARHSACATSCARVWPPLVISGAPRAGPGVDRARLGTIVRAHEDRQLTYAGHPLYRMSADRHPGDTTGEGFLGAWFAVSPSGHRIVGPGGGSRPPAY
jgi:predicted lipoprotein with Yx(FWY)xxD motif